MNRERNEVILVDELNNEIGQMDKLLAHQLGELHRAFSIFIFNSKKEILLQQRASSKYHGANLWTNTCCSHPQVNEENIDAANDRLKYEMGIETHLEEVFSFIYKANVENDLIEHELDFVFIGIYNGIPQPNTEEVRNWKWITIEELERWMQDAPQEFTYWFKDIWHKVKNYIPS